MQKNVQSHMQEGIHNFLHLSSVSRLHNGTTKGTGTTLIKTEVEQIVTMQNSIHSVKEKVDIFTWEESKKKVSLAGGCLLGAWLTIYT